MVVAFGMTNKGQKRANNEDNFLINNTFRIYAVADGMGGHRGGEYSSGMAVKIVESLFYEYLEDPDATVPDLTNPDEVLMEKLKYAINQAGKRIFEEAKNNPELHGMGTTFSCMVVGEKRVILAHIGDSRVYLFKDGQLDQLTEDHTLVHEQIKAGHMKKGEMKSLFLKSILTRSLGYHQEAEVDFRELPIQSGDLYLLSSDGLINMVTEEEIRDVLARGDVEEGCIELVRMANEKGGDDNITVVLVKIL